MGFLLNQAQGAASNLIGGLTNIGMGWLNNWLSPGLSKQDKELIELQQKNELEKMDYQFALNQKAAEQSQKYNKELWDYTNYENQVEHMKNAGLNPALLYGNGGSGGVSAGGAKQEGVSQGTSQAIGMGLQWESIQAQTRLANAEAAKAYAEAAKTSGTDTEHDEGLIKLNEIEGNLKSTLIEVEQAHEENLKEMTSKVRNEVEELKEIVRGLKIDNDFKNDTYETRVNEIAAKYSLVCIEGVLKAAQIENTDANTQYINEKFKYYAQQVANETSHAKAALEQARAALENARAANNANNIRECELAVKQRLADYEETRSKAYEKYTDAFASEVEKKNEYLGKKMKYMESENTRAWIRLGVETAAEVMSFTPFGLFRSRSKTVKKPTYTGEETETYTVSGRGTNWKDLK